MAKMPHRLKREFNRKHDDKETIKQQSKLIINGIHKSHTNQNSYTFKQNEVFIDG